MSYSILFISFIYIGSAYFFIRQERKHKFERLLFYTFDQQRRYESIPKRDTLDSFLILFVGALLFEIGIIFLQVFLSVYSNLHNSTNEKTRIMFDEHTPGQFFNSALFIGGGVALVILGIRSIIANLRYKRMVRQQEESSSLNA